MLDLLRVADLHDVVDDVAGVLVQGVVTRAVEARARSIIVDAETSPHVEVAEGVAHLAELRVKARRLARGTADRLDVGHLGSDMVMEQDKGVGNPLGVERVAHGDQVGGRETELGVLATTGRPLACSLGEETHTGADHRLDTHLLGDGQDLVEFLQLLNDEDHLLAEFQPQQGCTDELIILVAVTHHETLGIGMDGEGGDHLRLAAGLDAKVVGKPRVDDLLHDLAELVHLDREDSAVLVSVTALRDRAGEGFIETADAVTQQVVATDEQGKTEPAFLGLIDQFHQIDLLPLLPSGTDHGVSRLVDAHIAFRPSLHIVECGVLLGDGSGIRLGHFLGNRSRGINKHHPRWRHVDEIFLPLHGEGDPSLKNFRA